MAITLIISICTIAWPSVVAGPGGGVRGAAPPMRTCPRAGPMAVGQASSDGLPEGLLVTLDLGQDGFFSLGDRVALVRLVMRNVSDKRIKIPPQVLSGRRLVVRYDEDSAGHFMREAVHEAADAPRGDLSIPGGTAVERTFDVQHTLDGLAPGPIQLRFPLVAPLPGEVSAPAGEANGASVELTTWLLPNPLSVVARVVTDYGELVMEFLAKTGRPEQGEDRLLAPRTVNNFMQLVMSGFYDGLTFHRIIANQFVQGGDPKGDGTGGPGRAPVPAEFSDQPHVKGIVSMARLRGDDNSAGSQFFIVHGVHLPDLDRHYTAFGRIIAGIDVLDRIASVEVEPGNYPGEISSPREPVVIRSIRLEPRSKDREVPKDG